MVVVVVVVLMLSAGGFSTRRALAAPGLYAWSRRRDGSGRWHPPSTPAKVKSASDLLRPALIILWPRHTVH